MANNPPTRGCLKHHPFSRGPRAVPDSGSAPDNVPQRRLPVSHSLPETAGDGARTWIWGPASLRVCWEATGFHRGLPGPRARLLLGRHFHLPSAPPCCPRGATGPVAAPGTDPEPVACQAGGSTAAGTGRPPPLRAQASEPAQGTGPRKTTVPDRTGHSQACTAHCTTRPAGRVPPLPSSLQGLLPRGQRWLLRGRQGHLGLV